VAKVNFKITPERVAEACSIVEYINLSMGDKRTVFIVAPRFVLAENGEYSMTIHTDEDGEIEKFDNHTETLLMMSSTTPKRLEKLIPEFREAAKGIVNPPNGTG
jgi:hypothetical protein